MVELILDVFAFASVFRRDEATSAGGFRGVRAEKAKQQRDSIFFFSFTLNFLWKQTKIIYIISL